MDKLTAITELTACKFVAKSLVCRLESALGVERATTATMPLCSETLAAIERIEREVAAGNPEAVTA